VGDVLEAVRKLKVKTPSDSAAPSSTVAVTSNKCTSPCSVEGEGSQGTPDAR
jgi:hypothetical protein